MCFVCSTIFCKCNIQFSNMNINTSFSLMLLTKIILEVTVSA